MPHFTIEYSANLDAAIGIHALCETVRDAALETGVFETGAVRVRAVRCDAYAVADLLPENGFADLSLRMGAWTADLKMTRKIGPLRKSLPPQMERFLEARFCGHRSLWHCHSKCVTSILISVWKKNAASTPASERKPEAPEQADLTALDTNLQILDGKMSCPVP